jgi:hypothetical protein
MQQAIVPTTMITIAFQNEKAVVKRLFELKAVKVKTQTTPSHLHHMFFGTKQVAVDVQIPNDNKAGEPDYYSSYE